MTRPDLSTRWLGLELSSPVVCGAGPVARDPELARALADAGVSAFVTDSLFEERILREEGGVMYHYESHADCDAEATSYQPLRDDLRFGPEEHLAAVQALVKAVPVPVVASLNGVTPGGWLRYGRLLQDVGASAIELNVYDLPDDPRVTADQIEARLLAMVRELADDLTIPVSVKLTAFHTSLPNLALRLVQAGAVGVVLFNRLFEPDIDPEELEAARALTPSRPDELRLRLRWLAVLSGQGGVDLAASGGVHDSTGATKAIMAGAHVVQMVSAVLRGGPASVRSLLDGLSSWMEEKGYDNLAQLRGCMDVTRCPDPDVYSRANYMDVLHSWHGNLHSFPGDSA
ncbi:MAG: dihydroorotate dehydrogenase-like protein [Planctomycetota bacterium]|nr:MAG: dihydroorotate dehydrogenase-like protein [Planctomycetota bacterium]